MITQSGIQLFVAAVVFDRQQLVFHDFIVLESPELYPLALGMLVLHLHRIQPGLLLFIHML